MFALLVLASLALTLPLWLFWRRDSRAQRIAHSLQRIPGPLTLPFVGNTYLAFNTPRNGLFKLLDTETRRYWPLFRTWNGPKGEVHFSDADHIETILRSSANIDKGYVYRFLGPWLGTGLLTGAGRKWHSHRKLITPTFHFKILDSFIEVFVEKTKILVDKLEAEVGNHKGFDVYPYITLCALDIICETAMGTEVNAQLNSQSPYVMAIYEITELTTERIFKPWLHIDLIYYLTTQGIKFKKDIDLVHGFTNKIIRERKRALQNCLEVTVDSEDEIIGKKKRKAFLDLLLESSENGNLLSDEDIREEVDTFMFEGHDTTSASLCWTLFLLGTHPEVQDKVFEELTGIFHGSSREPTMSDLSQMKYLEQVIKESLRLFPSVPFITRSLTQDVQIGEHSLPSGCHVNVHIYHVHRNPKYFPNPDTFDPDNFLPERVQGRHPYAYVPFSAGPRNCIGQKFALLEEKVVLSSIIRKFKVRAMEKLEDINLMLELILRPETGIKLSLELR